MNMKKHILLISSLLLAGATASAATILFDQSFTQDAGTQGSVDGTAVGNANTGAGVAATWTAGAGSSGVLRTDGEVFSNLGNASAHIGLGTLVNDAKGTANGIFTLTTVMAEPPTGSNWVAGGFATNINVLQNFTNFGGIGNALYRTNGNADFFAGPNTGGTAYTDEAVSGTQTFITVLDLSTHNNVDDFGTVTYYRGSVAPGNLEYTFDYTADFSIASAAISTAASGGEGVIQSFALTQIPEPGTLALVGIALGTLLIARGRKEIRSLNLLSVKAVHPHGLFFFQKNPC